MKSEWITNQRAYNGFYAKLTNLCHEEDRNYTS